MPEEQAKTVSGSKPVCLFYQHDSLSAFLSLLSFSLFLGQDVIEFKNISQGPYVQHSASLWTSFQPWVPQKCKETKINVEKGPDFLSLAANLRLNNLHSLQVAVSQQPGTICISLAYQQHLKRHKWHLEWQKSNTLGLEPPAPRITNTS